MNCVETTPHLEAYALDTLDLATRAQVDQHLQTCPECRRRVAVLREVVGELPYALGSASPLRPPPALKTKLMQAAQADLQSAAIRDTFGRRAAYPAPARKQGWLNPRLWRLSLAASALLIVALLLLNLTSAFRMQQAISGQQAAQKQIDDMNAQAAQAIPVLNSIDSRVIPLEPTDLAPSATGKVIVSGQDNKLVFVAYNLPQLPLGASYVLWTITKGVVQPVRQFTPGQNGFAFVVFNVDRNDPLLKEIFVTRQTDAPIFPSPDRVLVWRSDPNDSSDDFTFGALFPRPTAAGGLH